MNNLAIAVMNLSNETNIGGLIRTAMPLEIIETIEQVKADCERLKKEKGLTAFGEGQLQLANILMEIMKEI